MRATGLTIHPAVADDLDEAALWYAVEAGIGDKFLDAVGATLGRILDGPRKYQVIREGIRRAPVRKFPYGVFYSVDDGGHVAIYAAASLEKEPFYWLERMVRG